ncbi:MAG: hypothetical protein JST92_14950 [Deltaproteobacteria bacterium]|nr:hypothetical protein [Deltaproteobacteria bacterium]
MRNRNKRRDRRNLIEKDLVESRELDHEIQGHLAEAAGSIAEAEAAFRKLAEPDFLRR